MVAAGAAVGVVGMVSSAAVQSQQPPLLLLPPASAGPSSNTVEAGAVLGIMVQEGDDGENRSSSSLLLWLLWLWSLLLWLWLSLWYDEVPRLPPAATEMIFVSMPFGYGRSK